MESQLISPQNRGYKVNETFFECLETKAEKAFPDNDTLNQILLNEINLKRYVVNYIQRFHPEVIVTDKEIYQDLEERYDKEIVNLIHCNPPEWDPSSNKKVTFWSTENDLDWERETLSPINDTDNHVDIDNLPDDDELKWELEDHKKELDYILSLLDSVNKDNQEDTNEQ